MILFLYVDVAIMSIVIALFMLTIRYPDKHVRTNSVK